MFRRTRHNISARCENYEIYIEKTENKQKRGRGWPISKMQSTYFIPSLTYPVMVVAQMMELQMN